MNILYVILTVLQLWAGQPVEFTYPQNHEAEVQIHVQTHAYRNGLLVYEKRPVVFQTPVGIDE